MILFVFFGWGGGGGGGLKLLKLTRLFFFEVDKLTIVVSSIAFFLIYLPINNPQASC
jgi:hypothetical protein